MVYVHLPYFSNLIQFTRTSRLYIVFLLIPLFVHVAEFDKDFQGKYETVKVTYSLNK
jgi:hypothetical protein